jgi:3-methyladenine DNA glycosylase AlkD
MASNKTCGSTERQPAGAEHRPTAAGLLAALRKKVRPDKTAFLPGFFQAHPGGYGEGDRFLGVVVPDQRRIARQFSELSETELARALKSPWHEVRLTALFVLVRQFERARGDERLRLVRFYLARLSQVNNWDLTDSSAPQILGAWLLDHPLERKILFHLARSKVLWEQRIAIVATMPLVKAGQFDELLEIAHKLSTHKHDLIHKATGWLLREMGMVRTTALLAFLDQHARTMPRTMLRYAIEKLPPDRRQYYLTLRGPANPEKNGRARLQRG